MTAAQPWGSDAGPVLAGRPPDRRRRLAGPIVVAVLVAVALGVATGQVWRLVAPRVPIVKLEQGYAYAEGQPEQVVAADGWFGLVGLIAGVLAAVMAWRVLRHRRGVVVLTALVLGSLVGGWLGWWLGVGLETASFEARAAAAPVGATLDAPLSLRATGVDRNHPWPVELSGWQVTPKATGVMVAQALAAAFTYTVLAAFATDPELRPDPPELSDEGFDEPGQPIDPWAGVGPGDHHEAGTVAPGAVATGTVKTGADETGPVATGAVNHGDGEAADPGAAPPRDGVRPVDPASPERAGDHDAVRPAAAPAPDASLSSAPGAPADPKAAPESP